MTTMVESDNSWRVEMFVEVLVRVLCDELAFVLLPLGVITGVRVLMQQSTTDILLLPEWSFASVVLLASGLSRFVEFKTELQQDRSFRVQAGIRISSLLIVVAVLLLALAVARPYGVRVQEAVFAKLQIGMLMLSGWWVGMATFAPTLLRWEENKLPSYLSARKVRRALWRRLRDVESGCRYLKRALVRASEERNTDTQGPNPILDLELMEALKRIQVLSTELASFRLSSAQSPTTPPQAPVSAARAGGGAVASG